MINFELRKHFYPRLFPFSIYIKPSIKSRWCASFHLQQWDKKEDKLGFRVCDAPGWKGWFFILPYMMLDINKMKRACDA